MVLHFLFLYLLIDSVTHEMSITEEVQKIDMRRPWNPMEIRWAERNSEKLNKLWKKLPVGIQSLVITLSVFILGISIKGEWFIFAVHFIKQYNLLSGYPINGTKSEIFSYDFVKDFILIWPISNLLAYSLYFSLGGFIHWYFYIKQKDQPEKWKCQPDRWLSPELEVEEIILGCISLAVTNTYSTFLTCYVRNGGRTQIYYQFDQYSWTWWLLQWPFIFVLQDYMVYFLHRLYHTPYLYKHFHKLHHKYKQPTAFSVTAIHPLEILNIQVIVTLPIFLIPLHWLPFYGIAFYSYYNGMIDHSGVDFKSSWWTPWRPDTIFHDNHHQYFHVNFGLNSHIWDYIHGTYRRNDRIYNENIYYGKGKPLTQATNRELIIEEEERRAENPRAHRKASNYLLPTS